MRDRARQRRRHLGARQHARAAAGTRPRPCPRPAIRRPRRRRTSGAARARRRRSCRAARTCAAAWPDRTPAPRRVASRTATTTVALEPNVWRRGWRDSVRSTGARVLVAVAVVAAAALADDLGDACRPSWPSRRARPGRSARTALRCPVLRLASPFSCGCSSALDLGRVSYIRRIRRGRRDRSHPESRRAGLPRAQRP